MSKFFPLHPQEELPNDSPINSPVSLLSTWVSSQRRPLALCSSPTFPSFAASPIKRKGDDGRFPRHLPRHLKFRTWRMLHGDVGLQPPHRLRKPVAHPFTATTNWQRYLCKQELSWDYLLLNNSLHKSSAKKVRQISGDYFCPVLSAFGATQEKP